MSLAFQSKPTGADALFAQHRTHIAEIILHAAVDSRIHVHFHQEVHTALQVEPEIHLAGTDRLHPTGGCRRKIECDDIVTAKRIF